VGFRTNSTYAFSKTPIFPSPPSRSSTGLAITRGDSRQLRTSAGLAPVAFSFPPSFSILNRGNREARRVATGHDYAIKFTTDIKLEIQVGEKNPGTQHPNKKHFK